MTTSTSPFPSSASSETAGQETDTSTSFTPQIKCLSHLHSQLVEEGGEVDELKEVAEDHLACKVAPSLKRLTFELSVALTTDTARVLREAKGGHAQSNQGFLNQLASLQLLSVETKDTVDGVF